MKRKTVFFMLALIMVFSLMPISVNATESTIISVSNKTEFEEAIDRVNKDSGSDYTIELTDDIQIDGMAIQKSCKTTILGNGHTLTTSVYGSIHVNKGAELTLGAADGNVLNIRSAKGTSNDEPGMLNIEGTCNMYSGVTLSGREGNNYFGGGVTVSGGTFHMYGGQFIMDSGTIKECYATSDYVDYYDPTRCFTAMGGGVFVSGGSSFVMNGGSVSNNSATNMGGGVAVVASYEEISGGLGNLKSSVEILGGKVEENKAKKGAGVFASAYYYAFANAICADTPAAGASKKPGLHVKNAQILDNTADTADGMGGGMLVSMLKSPAAASIENATVKGNKAATGAGIASYGYWTKMNITRCIVTENTANKYGGGFAAENNKSGGKTTFTDTVLCNNIAEKAGSDVYLKSSPAALQSAPSMDSLYLGKPEDVHNHKIDGWYEDVASARYTGQTKEERKEYTGYTNIGDSDEVYLIAAAKPSLAKIKFTNEDGSHVYKETWYPIGTTAKDVVLPDAAKESDETYDYVFKEWSPAIKDVTEDAVYTAVFEKAFKEFKVQYEFSSLTSGKELPAEVMSLLPKDSTGYARNTEIKAIVPSKTEVKVDGGAWYFKGFDKDSVTATMENADESGNVKFTGSWKFTAADNRIPSDNGGTPSDNDKTPSAKSGSESPQTGDSGNIGFWLTLLLLGGGALIATTAVRTTKKNNK